MKEDKKEIKCEDCDKFSCGKKQFEHHPYGHRDYKGICSIDGKVKWGKEKWLCHFNQYTFSFEKLMQKIIRKEKRNESKM